MATADLSVKAQYEEAVQRASMQVTTDLTSCAIMLERLLGAVDLFPLGGLCNGHYAEQAIRRYWLYWMPLLHQQQALSHANAALLVPPLDVQWAWFVHRLNPIKYVNDCTARFGAGGLHAAHLLQSLGFSSGGSGDEQEQDTRLVWEAAYPSGPGQPAEHTFWPPAPLSTAAASTSASRTSPSSAAAVPVADAAAAAGVSEADAGVAGSVASVRSYVIEAMPRQGKFLHQVLRSPYRDPTFLAAARVRYMRFLGLAAVQPPDAAPLVPMYDIDLLWHAHMALSGEYGRDCAAIMTGRPEGPARLLGHDDGLSEGVLGDAFGATRQQYEAATGLMYNVAPTRRLPTSVAHPLVAPLWPLAALLNTDPRVTGRTASRATSSAAAQPAVLPSPHAVSAQLVRAEALRRETRQHWQGCGEMQCRRGQQGEEELAGQRRWWWRRLRRFTALLGGAITNGAGLPHRGRKVGVGSSSGSSEVGSPMLGSPDHLSRNGVFALFALWSLAQALQGGRSGPGGVGLEAREAGAVGKDGKAPVVVEVHAQEGAGTAAAAEGTGRQWAPAARSDGGSSCRRGPGAGGGAGSTSGSGRKEGGDLLSRVLGASRRRDGGGGGGGGRHAEADRAMSHMTSQLLLLLADPAHPHSPLASCRHTFWNHLFPLPTPPPPTPVSPSPPSPAPTPPAPPSPSLTLSHHPPHRRPRHPHPLSPPTAPVIDLPAGFSPAIVRNVDCRYLAPHHYACPGPVFYTPADYCLMWSKGGGGGVGGGSGGGGSLGGGGGASGMNRGCEGEGGCSGSGDAGSWWWCLPPDLEAAAAEVRIAPGGAVSPAALMRAAAAGGGDGGDYEGGMLADCVYEAYDMYDYVYGTASRCEGGKAGRGEAVCAPGGGKGEE
ncbi:hypothetical protein Agub_g3930, partial [Astrephomene gubernaculifera]